MKLYAHDRLLYENRGKRVFVEIPSGHWREVPDELGEFLLSAHPQKLCDVSREKNPDKHRCQKSARYLTSQLESEHKTVLVPQGRASHQRLEIRRRAYRRSRVARVNPAARGA